MKTRLADFVPERRGSTRVAATTVRQTHPTTAKKVSLPHWQIDSLQGWLLLLLIVLCGIGLFFVFEASTAESFVMVGHPYHFLRQQSIWMALGIIPLIIGWSWPFSFWQKTAFTWYVGAIIALIAVFIPGIGVELNGAHRWIQLGSQVFQPAEFVKFAIVIFFASWMSKHQRLGAFLLFLGLPAGLILLQPDLGSLLVVTWIALGMYFLAEGKVIKLLPFIGLGLLGLVAAIMLSPYRFARLTTYLNPDADPLGKGFHVRQIVLALGNGGWFGKGLGNSTQKYLYIPEASSDSVFAVVGEEIGLMGACVVIGLFIAVLTVIFKLIQRAEPQSFERLVGQGILLWLSGQIVLNLAAVVALVPLTGIPLPFFSYGGSSLLMMFFIMGLMLRLSQPKS
jgi:cell division protein FtsW